MRRAIIVACLLAHALTAEAQYQSDVGFTRLQIFLNGQVPDGAGVKATLVEAGDASGNYMPDVKASQFAGKTFRNVTSASSGVSAHATGTASLLVGAGGMAPAPTAVDVYYAGDWLTTGFLKTNSAKAPLVETSDVASFSWIGNY